ncbi:MAG: AraC family transcriptional regulator [Bacteroidaceae bacterium]|nr:AraC family transcriptional regulator [Bacteroidaceae bacterium]
MRKLFSLLILSVVLACLSCTGSGKSHRTVQPSDSLYTDTAAMLVYGTDPGRAFQILDSAVIVGNISPFCADVCRAIIYGNTLVEEQQMDSSIQICLRLLESDSTSIKTPRGMENRIVVLRQLGSVYNRKSDSEMALQYYTELAELLRESGDELEALRTEAEIGLIMADLGWTDEALAKLDKVIRGLNRPLSVDCLDASIVAMRRQISVLTDLDRKEEIISLSRSILAKLDHFEQHQGEYADDSFRLPPIPKDRVRYIDFCRAQAYAILSRTFDDRDSVRHYLTLFNQSDYAKAIGISPMIVPALIKLGEYERAQSIFDEQERMLGTDTLNKGYAFILKGRATIAHKLGRISEAYDYNVRYANLQNKLHERVLADKTHIYAVRYQLHEQQLKAQKAETSLRVRNIILVSVLILLVLLSVVSLYYNRLRHLITDKNRALVRMINGTPPELTDVPDSADLLDDAKEVSEDIADEQGLAASKSLFETIDSTVREERLYANINLQRQDIISRFGIGRHTLNNLLTTYAGVRSFTQYVNEIRMAEAVELLRNNPEMTLTAVATAVGFSPANLRDKFKQQYGMTPAEYRQNM